MSLDRNAIYQALFNLAVTGANWQTTSQRLKFSNETVQPALFLRRGDEQYPPRDVKMPRVKVTLNAEFFIFYNTSDVEEAPGIMLDSLVTALEDALRPAPFCEYQSLGGLVQHCWIEGEIKKDDGALTGQAIALVPVKILTVS